MALKLFTIFAEELSDARAFASTLQNPLMLGRTRYQLLDTILFPSDQLALKRAEATFGVQPQADRVSIAGANTNTVWAIRIVTQNQGMKRLMFFGVR